MKRITAIIITAIAIVGCSYNAEASGFEYTSSTTCEQVLQLSGFDTSKATLTLASERPDVVADARKSLVSMCEAAKGAGKAGATQEEVMVVIATSAQQLPEEQAKIQIFTGISGWKIGELERNGK